MPTSKEKQEIAQEILANMKVTKEQYIEMCKLCDDLDLSLDKEPVDPESLSWDEILDNKK